MQPDMSHPLVLFDGVCNLCESTVQFIVRHDKRALFRFAPLQSTTAKKILAGFEYEDSELGSVLLVSDGRVYRKSRAVLRIARQLDSAWPLFYYLFFWIPPVITDLIYNFIGSHRYKWFGKKDVCWIPDDEIRRRFIDD
jgi:predicted DCC family thiol-disulfide oxidoreductase YuxK